MNKGHGDPPADVRAFLPRPGEPVEQYAERLRALHRDLTLVLEAVERGLAAAGRTEEQRASEPDVAGEPPRWRRTGDEPDPEAVRDRRDGDAVEGGSRVEVREEEPDEPADPWDEGPVEIRPVLSEPPAAASDDAPRGPRAPALPRIEVMPAPSGERRRADAEDRRGSAEDRRSEEEPAREPEAGETEAEEELELDTPEGSGRPAIPRPQRFPARPSEVGGPAPEPEWVEAQFPAAPTASAPTPATAPVRGRPALSPAIVGALVAGWVTVVVLLVALLLV